MPKKKRYTTNIHKLLSDFLKTYDVSVKLFAEEIGVTESCILKIINEKQQPNFVNGVKIMNAIDIDVDDIEYHVVTTKKTADDPRKLRFFPREER